MFYTTNAIDNFNRQLRKVTKSMTIFPTDDALFKILYLVMSDITAKWHGGKQRRWSRSLEQFFIHFKGGISLADID